MAYNTGLYHLQNVKWMEASRLVLGFAEVHSRLAFDSLTLIVSAVLHLSVDWSAPMLVSSVFAAAVFTFMLSQALLVMLMVFWAMRLAEGFAAPMYLFFLPVLAVSSKLSAGAIALYCTALFLPALRTVPRRAVAAWCWAACGLLGMSRLRTFWLIRCASRICTCLGG
jgi:hypothetical protein